MTIIKATPADAGCWIDGHWGIYGISRLCEIAQAHGAPLTPTELRALEAYGNGETHLYGTVYGELFLPEFVTDTADACEAWLNREVAPDGYAFGWHDGEFYLWPDAAWACPDGAWGCDGDCEETV